MVSKDGLITTAGAPTTTVLLVYKQVIGKNEYYSTTLLQARIEQAVTLVEITGTTD